MIFKAMKNLVASGLVLTWSSIGLADFLPPNDLHLQKNLAPANVNEAQFNEMIAKAYEVYRPIVAAQGASLRFQKYWSSGTVNAYASQSGGYWYVSMYGGLARRPEITPDGFMSVICHELGHHLAGFPFGGGLSIEGQSDYFATLSCLRKMWGDDKEGNAKARELIEATPRDRCNEVWLTEDSQNLCYRMMLAGKSAADMLAAGGGARVSFDKNDTRVVSSTYSMHPAAQCRLDTYEAGALCQVEFDSSRIPGKRFSNRNGLDAEKESSLYTCTRANTDDTSMMRPRCWFAPRSF